MIISGIMGQSMGGEMARRPSTEIRAGEVAPYVGFTPSLLFGVLALGLGAALARKLPLPAPDVSPLLVPVALATMLSGLFLIVARRQALMQVVGYLALENGIFAFGAVVMKDAPLLVEMGILLDIFVAVFVLRVAVPA